MTIGTNSADSGRCGPWVAANDFWKSREMLRQPIYNGKRHVRTPRGSCQVRDLRASVLGDGKHLWCACSKAALRLTSTRT